mgnify:CR=1 FL=1
MTDDWVDLARPASDEAWMVVERAEGEDGGIEATRVALEKGAAGQKVQRR